ncbi:IBP1 protein, partial [Amia calva]|nr:IBP1 protein [Amia calva]
MEPSEAARIQAVQAAENENAKNMAVDRDQVSLQYRLGHVTHSKPFEPREATEAQESMKANINANRKKLMEQGPCQVDLHRALEKITKSQQKTKFYLPNCDKHGFYNPKQPLQLIQNSAARLVSRSFSSLAPKWWNDLPTEVKTAESLTSFRRLLKTHLFRLYL